jgi:predicted RNase H-like HicB family nuclease
MLNNFFDVLIEEDKETKQYYGSFPNLPSCYSTGDTVEELITNIKEAISLYLEVS